MSIGSTRGKSRASGSIVVTLPPVLMLWVMRCAEIRMCSQSQVIRDCIIEAIERRAAAEQGSKIAGVEAIMERPSHKY